MIDAGDFLANIFDHGACRARSRQIAANDLDDASNPSQGIANLVGQASGHLSQGGKVLARDICVRCRRSISTRLSRSCETILFKLRPRSPISSLRWAKLTFALRSPLPS